MKFSEIASNQSACAVPSRTRGKWRVRRPMPWPRYGNPSIVRTRGGRRRPPRFGSVLLLVALDLAALLGAVVLAELHPALALAAVLPGASVAGAGAFALPLARVHAGAVHHVAAGLLVRAREHGAAEDQARGRARDQHPFGLAHSSSFRIAHVSLTPDGRRRIALPAGFAAMGRGMPRATGAGKRRFDEGRDAALRWAPTIG